MYVLGFIHVRMDFEIIGKDILMECEFFLISFWIVIKMKLKLCWLHNYLVDLINSNKYTLSQSLLVKCFRIHVLRQTKELCIFHIFDAWKFHIFDDETMLFFFFLWPGIRSLERIRLAQMTVHRSLTGEPAEANHAFFLVLPGLVNIQRTFSNQLHMILI